MIFLNFVKKATHLLFWRVYLQILRFCHIQTTHQLFLNAFNLGHIWRLKNPWGHILESSVRSNTAIPHMRPFRLWSISSISPETTFLHAHLIHGDRLHFLFQWKFVGFWKTERIWFAQSERNLGVRVIKFGGCFFGVWRHKTVFNERVRRNLRSPNTLFTPLIWTLRGFWTDKRWSILVSFCLLKVKFGGIFWLITILIGLKECFILRILHFVDRNSRFAESSSSYANLTSCNWLPFRFGDRASCREVCICFVDRIWRVLLFHVYLRQAAVTILARFELYVDICLLIFTWKKGNCASSTTNPRRTDCFLEKSSFNGKIGLVVDVVGKHWVSTLFHRWKTVQFVWLSGTCRS